MSNVIPFNSDEFNIRVVGIDGEPWFVGKDVAEALGYQDPTTAIRSHCKGVQKHHPLQTPGGVQTMRILSEPDVLRLIVGSSLPAAERFERWVFEEVLPSIRKTGAYQRPMSTLEVIHAQSGALLEPVLKMMVKPFFTDKRPRYVHKRSVGQRMGHCLKADAGGHQERAATQMGSTPDA